MSPTFVSLGNLSTTLIADFLHAITWQTFSRLRLMVDMVAISPVIGHSMAMFRVQAQRLSGYVFCKPNHRQHLKV